MRRRLLALLLLAVGVVGCSKEEKKNAEPRVTRDNVVCEPVRISCAFIALMEKPDAFRALLIGDEAKALSPVFVRAGLECQTDLGTDFDLIVADCARMSPSSFAKLRDMLAPDGVVVWLMDVRGVTMSELHARMSEFELYDVHLWMPGRDRWLLAGGKAPRRLRLSELMDVFTRDRTFDDLAKAKCGTLPEMFANYAGSAKDFAPAFSQKGDGEARPEYFLTKQLPQIDWVTSAGMDTDIVARVSSEITSLQRARRLAVEGEMLADAAADLSASTNAVELLAKAAWRNPNDLFVLERLDRLNRNALGFLGMGKILLAMKCYETMVIIQPNDPVAVNNFGTCLMKVGKTDLAKQVKRRAEKLAAARGAAAPEPDKKPQSEVPKPTSLPSGSRYKTSR